jgi:hypothetical protein
LAALIKLVIETAQAKGWDAYVHAKDERNFRYATISVSRVSGQNEITGSFEIQSDDKVKITHIRHRSINGGYLTFMTLSEMSSTNSLGSK